MSDPGRHARLVSIAALAAAAVGVSGVAVPPMLVAAGLAVAVAVVGLPHGGLDHRAGRAVFRPVAGRWWPLPFLAGYLAVGGLVLAGWALAPLTTVALFFALSAAHFAETECRPAWRAALFGGMVIWLPLVARPEETLRLLAEVAPAEVNLAAAPAAVRPLLIPVAVAAAGRWLWESARAVRGRDGESIDDLVRLFAFAVMFAVAPVALSFAVAFCGWHSLVELRRMAAREGGVRPVLLAAAPASVAAALLAALGVVAFGRGGLAAPDVLQAVFLGLSAVAVPHILLHRLAANVGGSACGSTTPSPAAASPRGCS